MNPVVRPREGAAVGSRSNPTVILREGAREGTAVNPVMVRRSLPLAEYGDGVRPAPVPVIGRPTPSQVPVDFVPAPAAEEASTSNQAAQETEAWDTLNAKLEARRRRFPELNVTPLSKRGATRPERDEQTSAPDGAEVADGSYGR